MTDFINPRSFEDGNMRLPRVRDLKTPFQILAVAFAILQFDENKQLRE